MLSLWDSALLYIKNIIQCFSTGILLQNVVLTSPPISLDNFKNKCLRLNHSYNLTTNDLTTNNPTTNN